MPRAWPRAGLFFLSLALLAVPAMAQPSGLPDDLSGDAEARGFADLLFAHGMVELAQQDYREALPLFEKAARTLPGDATYAYFAGLCKLRLGRYVEALQTLEQVLPPAEGRIPEARIRYDIGDAWYRVGEYDKAATSFRTAVRLDPSIPLAHFYLGVSEFALGNTQAAIGSIQRATGLDPALEAQADYYLGLDAFDRGDLSVSRNHFEKIQGSRTVDPGTSRSGQAWLSFLDQLGDAQGLDKTDFRVSFFIEHDDNPGQINEDVFVPSVDSDVRAVLQARADYRPYISDSANVDLTLNGYVSRHAEDDEVDLAGIQGVFQLALGGDPLGYVSGPLGYARVPVAERSLAWLFQLGASNLARRNGSLRRDYEAAVTAVLHQPDFGKLEVSLHYDDVTYFDAFNDPYSGHATAARIGQVFYLGGPARYLRLAVERIENEARERALERTTDLYQVEAALPLGPTFNLFLSGSYREDDYAPESAAFYAISRPRDDETIELVAKLTMRLTRRGFLTFRHAYTDRDSPSLPFATYERQISSLGYTRQW